MNRGTKSIFAITVLAWTLSNGRPAMAGPEKMFKGEIADSQCALNVHSANQSHKEMIAMTPSVKTDADCARYCVKERGGRFVLQTKDNVYKLDKQDLAEQNIGGKVKVIGTLNPQTNIIAVRSIEPIPDSSTKQPTPK